MGQTIITRKSGGGGGGVSIDETIESYTVAIGETVTAGTFVDYVNNLGAVNAFYTTDGTQGMKAVKLSETSVLVVFKKNSGALIEARVLSISGNSITTPGSTFSVTNFSANDMSVVALSSTSVIVAFINNTNNRGTARVLSISGSTISAPGSNFEFNTSSTSKTELTFISSTLVVVSYSNGGNSSYGTARALSISGTTISAPSSAYVFYSSETSNITSALINSTSILLSFRGYGPSETTRRAVVLTISGTTISSGGSPGFDTIGRFDELWTSLVLIDTNKFVYTYSHNSNLLPRARVLTITSTTTINTPGNELFIETIPSVAFSSHKISSTSVFVVFRQTASPSNGYGLLLSISSNTVSKNGDSFIFQNTSLSTSTTAYQSLIGLVYLQNNDYLIAFSNNSNSDRGTAKVVTLGKFLKNATNEKVFGLAKTSATAGETAEVYVNL